LKTAKPPGRIAYARITHIHRLISARRYPNVPYLAERIEVSKRTIERLVSSNVRKNHLKKSVMVSD